MSEVSKFIYEVHGPVESSGEFTISPSKAREKLARSLLESSSDCLLKLVQAAVLDGADSITITISRYGFKVRANGAKGLAPGALEKVDSDSLLTEPVSLAVHSLVFAGAEVVYERTSEGLQSSQLLQAKTSHTEGPRWTVEATFKRGFLSSLVDGLKDRTAWHRALHRCRFSPVPITLGRRDIIDPYPDRTTRPFFQKPINANTLISKNFSLYEAYEVQSGPSREGFRCLPGCERKAFRRTPKDRSTPLLNPLTCLYKYPSLQGAVLYHETSGPQEGALYRRAIRIPIHLQGNSQLTVIYGGVALELEEFSFFCPGVEILESLGDLKVDLSGLKLVRDDALQRRLGELDSLIRKGVADIQANKSLLPRILDKRSPHCYLSEYIDRHLPSK